MLWSDAELDEFINEAQREYAVQSRAFSGAFEAVAGRHGTFKCPPDFIEPIRFIGTDGYSRPLISWKHAEENYGDFRKAPGTDVRAIITDFDSFGTLRVFPCVPKGTRLGTLFYTRLAAPDTLETTNDDAIESHALYQALMYSANSMYSLFYDKFAQAVNRECTDRRGLSVTSSIREGCFY